VQHWPPVDPDNDVDHMVAEIGGKVGRESTKRGHALLAPDFGPPGSPFLPKEGEVYWVRTLLYSSTDPAPARPAVVLLVPALASARIQIVTRTSGSPPGVAHPADGSLGLEVAGVFSDLESVERSAWCQHNVRLCGQLEESVWTLVQEHFS
jgi:mRNA-degrading endonuclease toxin of MazEF toxin-antitoxin module